MPIPSLLRFVLILVAASTLLIGCATFRSGGRPSDPTEALRYDIDAVLADSIFIPARTSIKVVSLESREVLYERDSKLLMRPASNMKLLTSATALHALGKDYKFKTAVLADTNVREGIVDGNLYFKGYGNPDLKTSDLDTLVRQLKAQGIKEVRGQIFADVSFFDDFYWGYGWNWDDEPYQYAAFISPLSINDNCVRVKVTPGLQAGDSVHVQIEPSTGYVSLMNIARTVADTALLPLVVTRPFKERQNTIIIDGEIVAGSKPIEREVSVWKPELYAARLLTETLKRDSIIVEQEPAVGAAPLNARELAVHYHGLDSMVVNLNKISDNLSAELTLKTLCAVKRGTPASSQGGIYVINEFMNSLDIDTTRYFIADGSGLSFYNLLTAEMITQLLESMPKLEDIFPLFYESLPIAGVDGTLRNRMKGTLAESNVRAKTGTVSGVSSLSGYVKTLDGEQLVFSMSMQNFIYPTRLYQQAQDKICALLASFSRIGRIAAQQQ